MRRRNPLTKKAPYKACSGFTHVTARRIAQPPKATFVTRLQPSGYPAKPLVSFQINRQLSGWNLPPLMIRALGAHGHLRTIAPQQMALLFDHLVLISPPASAAASTGGYS